MCRWCWWWCRDVCCWEKTAACVETFVTFVEPTALYWGIRLRWRTVEIGECLRDCLFQQLHFGRTNTITRRKRRQHVIALPLLFDPTCMYATSSVVFFYENCRVLDALPLFKPSWLPQSLSCWRHSDGGRETTQVERQGTDRWNNHMLCCNFLIWVKNPGKQCLLEKTSMINS